MKKSNLFLFLLLMNGAFAMTDTVVIESTSKNNVFAKHLTPNNDSPEVIGFYTRGCLKGGRGLEISGQGYEVVRPQRKRYFGHPELIELIEEIAADSEETLLIGDISQPRGGPMPYGHSSHQVGLDADIFFMSLEERTVKELTPEYRKKAGPISVVHSNGKTVSSKWTSRMGDMLLRVASSSKVERIFVNAAIKRKVCETHSDHPALYKIRPWYNHTGHFHVRIKCPKGSPKCQSQGSPAKNPGCEGELKKWLGLMASYVPREHDHQPSFPGRKKVKIPKVCLEI